MFSTRIETDVLAILGLRGGGPAASAAAHRPAAGPGRYLMRSRPDGERRIRGAMSSTEDRICELHRLDDASALGDAAAALEQHGIDADVRPVRAQRLTPWAADAWRLMVRCRDVVYARWVAAAAGLDTWPNEEDAEEA